ncbi:MAG: DUF1214 domain-containing protein [Pseudomonadota bacterium]
MSGRTDEAMGAIVPSEPNDGRPARKRSAISAVFASPTLRGIVQATANFAGLIIFATLAVLFGISSSWYVVQRGLPFNSEKQGAWVVWTAAGDTTGEPYSRARFNLVSSLAISAERIQRFEARFDNEGRRLHSSCTYVLDGTPIDAQWWTLAVFDDRGRLIRNPAQRYGFNMTTVARDGLGRFQITLSRDAKPGNWLPTGTAGRMVLILEVQGAVAGASDGAAPVAPPQIRRTDC